jgi:hypothetical protein
MLRHRHVQPAGGKADDEVEPGVDSHTTMEGCVASGVPQPRGGDRARTRNADSPALTSEMNQPRFRQKGQFDPNR